jgi:DNA-binding Lrp family transcriptional regulator
MKNDILRLLNGNARLTSEEIAERLDSDAASVQKVIDELENDKVIRGYQAVIDESLLPETKVKAIIEVKIQPQRDGGFDNIAKRLANFAEVNSLYLVSGGYDLELEVQGETLQEVAGFVSSKLATIEGVTSTATHFILKKYKEAGTIFEGEDEYERLKVSP